MDEHVVGLVSPGAMGSAVGAAVASGGTPVLWSTAGRSEVSRARADADGLTAVPDLATLVDRATVLLSICPPHAASDVAADVAALGFRGIYVDANAVSPATVTAIGASLGKPAGDDDPRPDPPADPPVSFVDGGIIGGPPRTPGTTRLYLAGRDAGRIAGLFTLGPLEAIVLDGDVPAASALKMAYAGWTKGTTALLLAARAYAAAAGVDADLLAEWDRSQPGLVERSEHAADGAGPKAWRFVGEMEEIAASYAASGLPPGFHEAAAEIYRRLAGRKDASATSVTDAVSDLLGGDSSTPATGTAGHTD